ncbi:MAG TPA: hypothetical protein VE973_03810 [Candidatus Limnocylindria bacterium]|nr:hypothetical protein [Candidatus Limnocylindria bacterium]
MRNAEYGQENFITPEEMESTETRKEKVMEGAQQKRYELFANVLIPSGSGDKPELQKKLMHLVFGVGDAIMLKKAITGKDDGKAISRNQRFVYGAAVATEIIFLVLAYEHQYAASGVSKMVSEGLTKSDLVYSTISSAVRNSPKLLHMLETTKQWVLDKQFPQLQTMVTASIEKLNVEELGTHV